jgi:chromosome segregation ATPase
MTEGYETQQLRMQLADHGETITRLEAEIARLRAARIRETNVRKDFCAEIERLRADVELSNDRYVAAIEDNERLRAALQDIAEDPYAVDGGAAEIARRALEPKP